MLSDGARGWGVSEGGGGRRGGSRPLRGCCLTAPGGGVFQKVAGDAPGVRGCCLTAPGGGVFQKVAGDALGGPYVAVHLRRRDYERSHPESVPSVTKAAERIRAALLKTGLNTVYISTDAHDDGTTWRVHEASVIGGRLL